MSNGVLLYAYNNDTDDYVELAKVCAKQIRKFMPNVGITLITNEQLSHNLFDNIIIQEKPIPSIRHYRTTDNINTIKWFNGDRISAYNLSPYDKTILMDVDYIVFNKSLGDLFKSNYEILCYGDVQDASGQNSFLSDRKLHWSSINMLWATIIYFTKNDTAKQVFDLMSFIKVNYEYYRKLYNFKNGPYRNDNAISIAYNILGLYKNVCYNKMMALPPYISIDKIHNSKVIFSYGSDTNRTTSYVKDTNIHIMNKQGILDTFNESNS